MQYDLQDCCNSFHINIETSDGKFTIPRSSKLILNGRDSKILAADYDFESQHLVYATSEIFTHFSTGSVDVLAVYAYEGEEGEIALKINENVTVRSSDKGVTSSASDGITQINYEHPKNGTTAIQVSGGDKDVLILVSGYSTATKWWAPVVSKEQRVLIQGPYLVRSASISGDTLSFLGDIDTDTPIEVVASDNIRNFHWNGKNVSLKKSSYGSWTGIIKFQKPNIKITDLTKATWKYSPASPESDPNFDDSKWLTADHTTTNSTTEPISLPVLYADDYGKFYFAHVVYLIYPLTVASACRFPHWLHLVPRHVRWQLGYHWLENYCSFRRWICMACMAQRRIPRWI